MVDEDSKAKLQGDEIGISTPKESATPNSNFKKEGDATKTTTASDDKGKKKWDPLGTGNRRGNRTDCLSPEKRKELSREGGKAKHLLPIKTYLKCINCDLRFNCRRAFEESKKKGWSEKESRCVYEMEGRRLHRDRRIRDYHAFVSSDPADLLAKIHDTFSKLEEVVASEPSYTKLSNLLYMMMSIYRLKFGEKLFTMNVRKNLDGNPTLDVKSIMREIRNAEVVDVAPATPDEEGDVPKKTEGGT